MNCPYCDRTVGEDVGDCFKERSDDCLLTMIDNFLKNIHIGFGDMVDNYVSDQDLNDFTNKIEKLRVHSPSPYSKKG